MTSIRLRCCVPFCSRTRGARKGDDYPIEEGMEWICSEHWRAVPKKLRQVQSRSYNWSRGQPYRRRGAPTYRKNRQAAGRIWRRCKRAAIERAMGL